MERQTSTLLVLTPYEARTAAAVFERLFPTDESSPGAIEMGVLTYLDRALAGAYQDKAEAYRLGLAALDLAARRRSGMPFAECSAEKQDTLITELEKGILPNFRVPPQHDFFEMLRAHLQEGLFADPAHGGNRDKLGWKLLGHPGFWPENSAEENLATEPVTKGGKVQSLEDVGYILGGGPSEPVDIPGYDLQRSAEPPSVPADVVLVGMGAMGSGLARGGLGSRAVAHQARLLTRRVGVRLLLQREDGTQVLERDAPLAAQRERTDPGGHLLVGAHDERRGRLGHPLGRRAQALPSPPLRLPYPRTRKLRRGGFAGRSHFDRLACILR